MNYVLIVDDNPVDRELASQLVVRHTALYTQFANNGLEAVERLEADAARAVLTDLHMPEMDGLSLVRTVRRRFPTIPVVLMTAHGSEDIAIEALVEGAADYVPKHRLAVDLSRILTSVLGAVAGDRRHEEITRCLLYKQLRYSMDSDTNLIPPLVDQLQQAAFDLGLIPGSDRVRLARCLAEALHNSVTHGNGAAAELSPDSKRTLKVNVVAEYTQTEARFIIRDQGQGFDPTTVVDPREEPGRLTADSGRGMSLMRLFMDQVAFNATGNKITLVRRKPFGPPA